MAVKNFEMPDDMSMEEAQNFFSSNSTSISIDCDFGGRIAPFPVYIGEPKADSHPLQHQANWLQVERGGTIPPDVMASFETLQKIAAENNVSFQMLCVYAFGEAQNGQQEGGTDDAFTLAPPETPEMIPAEPVFEEAPPEEQKFDADSDAAAAMAAFSSYQQRIEEEQEEKKTPYSTPPIQD